MPARPRFAVATVLTLAVASLAVATMARHWPVGPRGFVYPDAYHYAEMGRQVARGEGFTTLQAYPYVLAWLDETGIPPGPPWPNVTRFPLIALLYAPAYLVAGANEETTHAVGTLFFVATACTSLLLGLRLFGAAVGVAAAVLFAINGTQITLAHTGLLEMPAAWCIVAAALGVAALTAARADGRDVDPDLRAAAPANGRRAALLLGLVLGAAFLLRHDLLALLVAALPVLAVGRGAVGRRHAAWVLVGFAVPLGLWVARNWLVAGSPLVFLGLDPNVLGGPGEADVYAAATYDGLWQAVRARPDLVAKKVAQLTWPAAEWRTLFGWGLAWLGPVGLAAGAVLIALRHRAARVFGFVLLAFVVRALIFTLTHHEHRFYASFTPVLLVLALGGCAVAARALVDAGGMRQAAATALVAGVAVLGLSTLHTPAGVPRRWPTNPPTDYVYDAIRVGTPPGTVIATSNSEAVAWHAERPAVDVPFGRIGVVTKLGVRVDGLLYAAPVKQVEKVLAMRGLGGAFVPVLTGTRQTLWLRPELVQSWNDAAPMTHVVRDQAG